MIQFTHKTPRLRAFRLLSFGILAITTTLVAPPKFPRNFVDRALYGRKGPLSTEIDFRNELRFNDLRYHNIGGQLRAFFTRPDFKTHISTPQAWQTWVQSWIKPHPPRKFIFDAPLQADTVTGWRTRAAVPVGPSQPKFQLVVLDPSQPEKTDILTTLYENPGATIQIASTFWGPLEGGMTTYTATLSGMYEHAVQGETATAATIEAAIMRKYFLPTLVAKDLMPSIVSKTSLNGLWDQGTRYVDLTQVLRGKIPQQIILEGVKKGQAPQPHLRINKYHYNPNHVDDMGVALHRNVAVTMKPDGTYDPKGADKNNRRVNLSFTSAYNLGGFFKNKWKGTQSRNPKANAWQNITFPNGEDKFAQMCLNASYAGTLFATATTPARIVFLTLMGGGAFRNRIGWIVDAIKRSEPIIKQYKLSVVLPFYPDKARPQDNEKIRTPEEDAQALKRLLELQDRINGTNITDEAVQRNLFTRYADNAYRYTESNSTDAHAYQEWIQAARELNALAAGRPGGASSSSAGPPASSSSAN